AAARSGQTGRGSTWLAGKAADPRLGVQVLDAIASVGQPLFQVTLEGQAPPPPPEKPPLVRCLETFPEPHRDVRIERWLAIGAAPGQDLIPALARLAATRELLLAGMANTGTLENARVRERGVSLALAVAQRTASGSFVLELARQVSRLSAYG